MYTSKKGIRPCRSDFGANKSGPPKACTQPKKSVPKIRVYRDYTCNASRQRGTAHILSREWMKGSLTGSASSLACPSQNLPGSTKYRFTGAPVTRRRDLFLWQFLGYVTRVAWGLLRTERTGKIDDTKSKRHSGESRRQKLQNFVCVCIYVIHICDPGFTGEAQKEPFLKNHREPRRMQLSA